MMRRFSNYRVLRPLSDKPLRQVYLVHPDEEPDQKMVLKVFDTICLNQDYEYDTFIERCTFIKELHHDHIVSINAMGIEQNQLYVATPYLPAGSLHQRLDKQWKVKEAIQ